MRWRELFEDLESQADAAARWQDEVEEAELEEAEQGRVALADRIRGGVGGRLTVGVDGDVVEGAVLEATRSWFVLGTGVRDVLVPMAAVRWVAGAGRVEPEPGAAESRLSLAHVLRRLAQQEATVRVALPTSTVAGRIDRVGLDHLEVVTQDGDGRVAVPFAAVVSVAL